MNLLVFIFIALFFLAVTDFMLLKQEKLHHYVYQIAFLLTVFLFTIKYYYGADMYSYVKAYDMVPSPIDLIRGIGKKPPFEIGFSMFLSASKWIGLSYWSMTAVISLMYFYAIYKLFKYIPAYKTFALFILVILDHNLIFATHRQCIAVSFFVLMYLAYVEKRYMAVGMYALLTVLIHKSGFVYVFPALILWGMHFRVRKVYYWFTLLLMIVLIALPLKDILDYIVQILPLKSSAKASWFYHSVFFARIQSVLLFYSIVLMLLGFYEAKESAYKKMAVVVFLGAVSISLFYQSFASMWRLRSYFIPFFIVYLFYVVQNADKEELVDVSALIKPIKKVILHTSIGFILLYFSYMSYQSYKKMNSYPSRIYETSTIFDLFFHSEEEIKKERMQRAVRYWRFDNMQDYSNYNK